jgi:ABC-type lipoprotein export system ATPase subunit
LKGAEKMIEIKNVSKTYGIGETAVKALDNVSLNIEDGEMIAIIGASGSGKSTLLHILGGLDSEAEGQVLYDDKNILKMDDETLSEFRLENIGFVFQFFNLIPELTAEENIVLPNMMKGKKANLSTELCSQLGIESRLKHYPDELSGGQKQRVAIARALANNPKVVFADEPTGALDSKTSGEIMQVFKVLNESGTTVVIITHDMEIAKNCNRIIEISDGRIEL